MAKPTVAAVQGVAVGAGASIATACDFASAHADAAGVQAFFQDREPSFEGQ
jgi:enoyl-CoA hydratase/carnithine racemase